MFFIYVKKQSTFSRAYNEVSSMHYTFMTFLRLHDQHIFCSTYHTEHGQFIDSREREGTVLIAQYLFYQLKNFYTFTETLDIYFSRRACSYRAVSLCDFSRFGISTWLTASCIFLVDFMYYWIFLTFHRCAENLNLYLLITLVSHMKRQTKRTSHTFLTC